MNLRFIKIDIEGFQSIEKANIILESQGIVLVRGINNFESNASSNGSGKSSIFEAIQWSIYGKTSSGISDPCNRYYKDGCMVKLLFSVDNQEYTIIRSSKHKTYKSDVKLFKGDEDISARNKSDTDKIIKSDVMPISQDVFLSTVFLSQGFSGRLSILTPSGRKERIEVLTDTASQVDEFRDKLTEVKSNYSEILAGLSSSYSYKQGMIDSINSQIDMLEREITEIESRKPEGNPEEISLEIEKSESLLSTYEELSLKLNQECSDLKTKISINGNSIEQLRLQINNIKHEIKDLQSGKPCPTCGRPMNEEPIDPEVIKSKFKLASELESKILEYESDSSTNKILKESKESKSIELLRKKAQLENKVKELRQRLIELSSFRDTSADKNKIKEFKSQIESINLELSEIKENSSNCESLRDVAHHCTTLISKQFRGYLLQEIIEFMNSKLKEYSSVLFSNESDIITLVVDSTKLDIFLGDALYDTLSGGERKKVDIALVLTQRDLALSISGISCNLLVLDEIVENCDETATNTVLDLLSRAASDIESMYIISHNNYSVPYDSILTVIKNNKRTSTILIN